MTIWDFASEHWIVAIILALIASNTLIALFEMIADILRRCP